MGLLCLMKKVSAYKYRNEQAIRVKFLNVTVYGCILTYSSKFLAVLGLPKILAILEGSEQIFPRKRSLGAPG